MPGEYRLRPGETGPRLEGCRASFDRRTMLVGRLADPGGQDGPRSLSAGGAVAARVRGDTRGAQACAARRTADRRAPTHSLASARVPARRIRRRDSGTRFSIECSAQPAETGTPGRLQGTPGLRSVGWSRLSWRLRTIHRSASDSQVRSSASPSSLTLTCDSRTSDRGSPDVLKSREINEDRCERRTGGLACCGEPARRGHARAPPPMTQEARRCRTTATEPVTRVRWLAPPRATS